MTLTQTVNTFNMLITHLHSLGLQCVPLTHAFVHVFFFFFGRVDMPSSKLANYTGNSD